MNNDEILKVVSICTWVAIGVIVIAAIVLSHKDSQRVDPSPAERIATVEPVPVYSCPATEKCA